MKVGAEGGDRWDRAAVVEVGGSLVAVVVVMSVFTSFLAWVETRPGVVLPDPVLAHLQPRDLAWITFGLIYLALTVSILSLLRHPRALALAVRSYAVMVMLRLVVMAVVPLDPPPGMIPLQDPLVFLGTGSPALTRDLFFSGPTATMFLVALNARTPRLRAVFVACTVGVATCGVWQAVHYTVDTLAAPIFAYAAYRIALATARVPQPVQASHTLPPMPAEPSAAPATSASD